MTFILFLSSAVVGFWVLLYFTPCNTGKNSFFDCYILNYFKIFDKVCSYWKTYQASWSISIDLDAQYVSSFTDVFLLKNSFFDCSILNYFKIFSRYVLIEKSYQASWSISIDLDAQYVSSFIEVFLWKTLFKHPFMISRKFYIISDQ